jgi:hypothetical protein
MRDMRAPLLGRTVVLGAGVLLLIDTFMPWQRLSIDGISYSWNAWHGDKGVVLGVLTIALIVWVGAPALGARLPATFADGPVTPGLALLVLIFAVVKTIREDFSAWGSYLGVALAAGAAVGTLLPSLDRVMRAADM